MATIKDITTMCKSGQIQEAYEVALTDWNNDPDNIWTQREVGWALYYQIKNDVENSAIDELYGHLEKLSELSLLDMAQDKLIFENVLWKLCDYLKAVPADNHTPISNIFARIQSWHYGQSRVYSYFIQICLKFEGWDQMASFIEWWDLDNLQAEDYQPFRMESGKTVMALAERVFIAYSKAILKLKDQERIGTFIPKLEYFAETYQDMIYLGYFCGKLLIAQGACEEDALSRLIPFVRKKINEFWAWQVLSEIFRNDVQKRLACLLRAVNCRTQESFLGKIRIALAELYISQNDFGRAKYHIDKVSACYLKQGWRIPNQIQTWINQSWLESTAADSSCGMDYKTITDEILYHEAKDGVAIVTYVDRQSRRASLIYGMKQKQMVKYDRWKTFPSEGMLLSIRFVEENDGVKIIDAQPYTGLPYVPFLKKVSGTVYKRVENQFAFINTGSEKYFITPNIVSKYNLTGGESINAVVVYDFNKKKNEWNWTCISINK